MKRSPFDILSVKPISTDEEIKRAYIRLAKECHPDHHENDPRATAKFQELNGAFEQIKTASAREAYKRAQQTPSDPPFSSGSRSMDQEMEDIFRGFHQTTANHESVSSAVEESIEISLEEAFKGVRRPIRLPFGTVEVSVPSGIEDHTVLRLKDAVPQSSLMYGRKADLMVRVRIRSHDRFARKGADLYQTLRVNPALALLGQEVLLTGIEGERIYVRVPAGVESKAHIRVAGYGMPRSTSRSRGDMFVVIDIDPIPPRWSIEQRQLLERLSATF